ncbi:MAG TPA: patatin-like phospholipase family protein [Thermoanaerobaculia bacterium]|nr:patatin-like phospholipase family protein [Thermoanaerobaculia bacterium]
MEPLDLLLASRKVGFVLSGGSARCAFQVGAIETLLSLGVRPGLLVGVSVGSWSAAAVAVGHAHRLRYYWRAFGRMPHVDLKNLWTHHSPYIYSRVHARCFERYVGTTRLRSAATLPLFVGVTRLADRRPAWFDARSLERPLELFLASNYLPPFYTHAPRLAGERYGDGALSDNLPYEKALEEGCDALVLLTMKGESEGGLFKGPYDTDHVLPPEVAERTVVIRPRHRLPIRFAETRWEPIVRLMDLGRLRAREVLLGERHPETDLCARGTAPSALFTRFLKRRPRS